MKTIAIISSSESAANIALVDDFAKQLNQGNTDFTAQVLHYADIAFQIENNEVTAFSLTTGVQISSFDFVYFKSYIRYEENANAIATILTKHNVPFVCSEVKDALSTTKLSQYVKLTVNGIQLPKTLYIEASRLAESYDTFVAALGLPFIMKAIDGKGGEANFLIHSREEYMPKLREHPHTKFVCQSFINNSGDLRVLIVNDKIELIIGRARKDDSTHLNNTSQGANADLLPLSELSPETQELSLKCARIMGREIAGVDVMFEKDTNKPYILEVNASPQVGSGAFVNEKLSVYKKFFASVLQKTDKSDIITD